MGKHVIVTVQTDKEEYKVNEPVLISLKILNRSSDPIRLRFNSAQRYDLIIYRDGKEVWRWSSGKVFAMALGSLLLKPKEERKYTEIFDTSEMAAGDYKLVGIIMSSPQLRANCIFRIKDQ